MRSARSAASRALLRSPAAAYACANRTGRPRAPFHRHHRCPATYRWARRRLPSKGRSRPAGHDCPDSIPFRSIPIPRRGTPARSSPSKEPVFCSWLVSWMCPAAWPSARRKSPLHQDRRTSDSPAQPAARSQASGAGASRSTPCCTPPFALTCGRSSKRRARVAPMAQGFRGSSRPSSSAISLAGSSPTGSRACAARTAVTNCWWPCPARGAASAHRAPPGGCTTRRRAWWTGFCRMCRCASGCSRCRAGRAGSWRATRV